MIIFNSPSSPTRLTPPKRNRMPSKYLPFRGHHSLPLNGNLISLHSSLSFFPSQKPKTRASPLDKLRKRDKPINPHLSLPFPWLRFLLVVFHTQLTSTTVAIVRARIRILLPSRHIQAQTLSFRRAFEKDPHSDSNSIRVCHRHRILGESECRDDKGTCRFCRSERTLGSSLMKRGRKVRRLSFSLQCCLTS